MRMYLKAYILFSLLCSILNCRSQAEEKLPWNFPVAVSKQAGPKMKQVAKSLAQALGQGVPVIADRNPVCCFWLEIDGWMPNPGEPGYVVIIQEGGAIIRASNEEQMLKAVERVKALRSEEKGKVLLPTGVLITSYRVIY